jgi:hypothetical protein
MLFVHWRFLPSRLLWFHGFKWEYYWLSSGNIKEIKQLGQKVLPEIMHMTIRTFQRISNETSFFLSPKTKPLSRQ